MERGAGGGGVGRRGGWFLAEACLAGNHWLFLLKTECQGKSQVAVK